MSYRADFIAVLRREAEHFAAHRTFLLLVVGLPLLSFLFFVLLFKTGVPREMPIAVLDRDHSSLSRQLTRMVDATPSAAVKYNLTDMEEGRRLMMEGKIDAIVELPRDLERDVYRNQQAHVTAYINGLNLTKNGLLNKDLQTAITTFSTGIQLQMLVKKGLSESQAMNLAMPIYYEKHVLFNPYTNYGYYLLPSFLPLMLVLFVLLSTLFAIGIELKNSTAREWLATAGDRIVVALAGKLLPYTVVFIALYGLMNTIIFKFLDIPLQGSVGMLFTSGVVCILAYQALGIFLAALLSNLRLSLSLGGGYSVLSFTFSGLTFPFMAMSPLIRIFGYVFPLTFYIEIFIDQALRGAPVVNSAAYLGYMTLFLLLPLLVTPRLKQICTQEKFWGRL